MSLLLKRVWGPLLFETYDCKPDFEVVKLNQVHGNHVVAHDLADKKEVEADGMILDLNFEKPAAIITADCLPIIIEGKNGFAFLHAGWRGLHNNIIHHQFIRDLEPHKAYIGPHIKSCCFEVQPEFKANFPQEHFYQVREHRLFCDLTAIAQEQLMTFYKIRKVDTEMTCTCCTLQFKSFRRDGTIERNWNIVRIKK